MYYLVPIVCVCAIRVLPSPTKDTVRRPQLSPVLINLASDQYGSRCALKDPGEEIYHVFGFVTRNGLPPSSGNHR